MKRRLAAAILLLACGCAGPPPQMATSSDVRQARDRPPVVILAREGDPASAISVAISTGDDPASAAAIAGWLEGKVPRLRVTPAWDGVRATMLVENEAAASAAAEAIRAALLASVRDDDLVHAKKKLAALASRPIADASLAAWARCSGALLGTPGKEDPSLADLEAMRAAIGTGRVAFAVAGTRGVGEAVARTITEGPTWKAAVPLAAVKTAPGTAVFEGAIDAPRVHIALSMGSSSAAVRAAEALGDPNGPLETRLHTLDVPFHLREVVGAAHPVGGCVAMILEGNASGESTAARVADAVALVDVEARLAEGRDDLDATKMARRAGDVREAAERAAWWALADRVKADGSASVVLEMPTRRGGGKDERPVEPSAATLAQAIETAKTAWQKPVVDGRVKVESGQGETWVLIASPCGTDVEGELDAGATALAMAAARANLPEAEVFVAPDGAGLILHGAPLPGESAQSHAQRLGDQIARAFAGVSRARNLVSVREDLPAAMLGSVLSAGHPSWVFPWGQSEATLRIGEGVVVGRAQALRAGPLRVAVIANVDRAQGDAAVRAADRWIDRRGDAARACPTLPLVPAAKPGTYALDSKPGAMPEALLAFPIANADDNPARTIALAFDGDEGLLGKALGDLARSSSARVMGSPRTPALVLRIASPQSTLDQAVQQARALVDRVRQNGLAAADLDRATASALDASLDPRARLVATWRGVETKMSSAEDVRTFALRALGEDRLVVVAARPPRPKP